MKYQFSRTATTLKRSVMRDLLAQVARPDVLNFASGLVADENLPRTQLQECLDAVLTRDGARALQYTPPFAPLKELIAEHMHTLGVECVADDIFITNGNQQGLELCARLFLDDGARVAVEEFTFTGVLQAAQGHHAAILPIPSDSALEMDMDALEWMLKQGPRPCLIITIPDFHNPLGISLGAEKRERLASLATHYDIPIVEDSPYAPLRLNGAAIPVLKAYDEKGTVIYLGSFSKIISPALRLGWIVAPRELLPRLTVLREALDLESSQLLQRTVAEFLARGYLEPHLTQLNSANRVRRDRMLCALGQELGDIAHWTFPEGGLFVWLTLPEEVNTQRLLYDALAQNVAFVPGFAFAAEPGRGCNSLRLNFAHVPLQDIAGGIHCLTNVISQTLAAPGSAVLCQA